MKIKILFALFAGLLISQTIYAQQQQMNAKDTLLYYIDKHQKLTTSKDSVDHFLVILPVDSNFGIYPIVGYYPNWKRKFIGYSTSQQWNHLRLTGEYDEFFENNIKKSVRHYSSDTLNWRQTLYYSNGKLYANEEYRNRVLRLIDCRDSTGKVLAENGKGHWIKYDNDFKLYEEGSVKDSLEDGEWHGRRGDSITFVYQYTSGKITSGISYLNGKAYPFTQYGIEPVCKVNFLQYIAESIRYPKNDKVNNVQGKVFVQFIVDRNGKVTDVKVLRAPDESLGAEAARVVKSSPDWSPGILGGIPVKVMYTVPINFSLTRY